MVYHDYLYCSIFNLICCFFWLGIPALVFSVIARENYRSGNYINGQCYANIAKKINIAGIAIGSVVITLIIAIKAIAE